VLFQDTVLTAVHCCADNIAYDLQIVADEHDLSWNDGPEQFRNIARIIKHGAYNPLTLDNDMCLLKLAAPLDMNRYISLV
jgi:secreted trypsin-like serine protease